MIAQRIITVVLAVAVVRAGASPARYDDMDMNKMDQSSHEMQGQGQGQARDPPRDSPPPPQPERVWTFAFGRQWAPFEQLDEEKMQVVGLGIDFMHEVCEHAHRRCEFIFISEYTDCWDNARQLSPGLNNRWFDACANYNPTYESQFVLAFSEEYTRAPRDALFTRNNDNIIFDDLKRDNNEITIGFVLNYYPSKECLRRSGVHINEGLSRTYISPDEMMDALRQGEIRVAFTLDIGIDREQFAPINTNGQRFNCVLGGLSVMTRKDSQELLDWLNPAIRHVSRGDKYPRMCYIWEQIFDLPTFCFEENDMDRE